MFRFPCVRLSFFVIRGATVQAGAFTGSSVRSILAVPPGKDVRSA